MTAERMNHDAAARLYAVPRFRRGLAPGGRGSRRCGRCAAARSRPAGSEPVAVGRVGRSRRHRAAPPRGFRNGSRACRLAGDRRRVRRRIRMARRSAAEAARAWLRHVELRARGSSSRRDLGRRTGVLGYVGALALGALHAWTAASLALVDATRSTSRAETGRNGGWRSASAIARGLVIATPLVVVFGALFMSADAVFAELVANVLRFDFEQIASHILLFSILAWLSTGYLRGFLTGTELPPLWRRPCSACPPRQSAPLSGSRKSRRRWRRSICCFCSSSSCSSATSSVATHLSR